METKLGPYIRVLMKTNILLLKTKLLYVIEFNSDAVDAQCIWYFSL